MAQDNEQSHWIVQSSHSLWVLKLELLLNESSHSSQHKIGEEGNWVAAWLWNGSFSGEISGPLKELYSKHVMVGNVRGDGVQWNGRELDQSGCPQRAGHHYWHLQELEQYQSLPIGSFRFIFDQVYLVQWGLQFFLYPYPLVISSPLPLHQFHITMLCMVWGVVCECYVAPSLVHLVKNWIYWTEMALWSNHTGYFVRMSVSSQLSAEHNITIIIISTVLLTVTIHQAHIQLCLEWPRWQHECLYCGNEYQSARSLQNHSRHYSEKPSLV